MVVELLENGLPISPTKGPAIELRGVLLELSNPRARLSRTETRGKPFSCLGELCWYLSGSNKSNQISYYLSDYKKYAERGELFGGYGPRMFGDEPNNQVKNIISILKRKPSSRQAVVQIFDSNDIVYDHKDVPCTCTLQFLIRENTLDLITYMRSNDIFLGFPHDIFSFTMIQEIVARALDAKLGSYKHMVGSIHLYERNRSQIDKFLNEGWQSTQLQMPRMPTGEPFNNIAVLLKAEKALRETGSFDEIMFQKVDEYWADLIRLLQVYRYSKEEKTRGMEIVSKKMTSTIYNSYIERRLQKH